MKVEEAQTLAQHAAAVRRMPGEVPSPCTSVCRMDPSSGFCEGCLRTLAEIAGWSRMEDAARRKVWRAIESRARAGIRQAPGDNAP